MNSRKWIRQVHGVFEESGVAVQQVEHSNNHLKHKTILPDGHAYTFITSVSPSDQRAIKNVRSHVRRIVREHA